MVDDDATFVVDGASAVVVVKVDESDTVDVTAEDDGIVDGPLVPVVVDDTLDTDCICVEDSTEDPVVVLGTTVVVSDAMVEDETTVLVD